MLRRRTPATHRALFLFVLLAVASLPGSAVHANPACYSTRYCCDQWYPEHPEQPICLVDINFSFGGEGPTEAQRQAVLNAGGRIVYEFHLERVRAQMCTADVPSLNAILVRAAPSGTDYTLDAMIAIPLPLSLADSLFLDSLGVQILDYFEFIDVVRAYVQDPVIPIIRTHPGVRYVQENGLYCCPLLKSDAEALRASP